MLLPERNWYKRLVNVGIAPDDWELCPECGLHPQVWIYDNGCHATCACLSPKSVRVKGICEVMRENKGDCSAYSRDDLRIAWNNYILEGTANGN